MVVRPASRLTSRNDMVDAVWACCGWACCWASNGEAGRRETRRAIERNDAQHAPAATRLCLPDLLRLFGSITGRILPVSLVRCIGGGGMLVGDACSWNLRLSGLVHSRIC